MRDLLEVLKGSQLIGRLVTVEGIVLHYLLPGGKVLEVVAPLRRS